MTATAAEGGITTTDTTSAGSAAEWWRRFLTPGWIIPSVGILFFLVVMFPWYNSLRNEGIDQTNRLNATYQSNQNELSQYANSFYEQLGVANLKSEKLDTIIKDAVQGRYQGNSSAVDATRGGAFFSAVVEAYPQLTGLDIYDKVVTFVQSGREAFKNKQNILLDQIRTFDSWRQKGVVRSRLVSFSDPMQRLEARIGTTVVRGQAALDQMKLIVTDAATSEAFKTGQGGPLTVPK